MALLVFDGFDHYAAATDMAASHGKWLTSPGGSNGSLVTGRFSGRGWSFTGGGSTPRLLSNPFSTPTDDFIIGFSFKLTSVTGRLGIVVLTDTTASSGLQCGLTIDTDHRLSIVRYLSNGTVAAVLGTSAEALVLETWYHIEVRFKISDASGEAEVRLNGSATPVINLTGVDTKQTANATATYVGLLMLGAGTAVIDDFYCMDDTGDSHNTFLGDTRVVTLYPNADTAQKDFARSAGSDNFALVDEAQQDGDTTYVESSTVGHFDLYEFDNLPGTVIGTIHGVQVTSWARKDDANPRELRNKFKSGATTENGVAKALPTGYEGITDRYITDPDTAAAWLEAGVNAIQAGPEVAA